MEKIYDLTKKEVLDYVYKAFPIIKIGKDLIESFINNTTTLKRQEEAAKTLIEEGRKNGVDEMEIIINNFGGVKVDVPSDVKIDVCVGNNDNMTLKVKYK